MTIQSAWEKQKKAFDFYRTNNPDLVKSSKRRTEADVFAEIGILNAPQDKPAGYLRMFFEDFLVEEKTQLDRIMKINELSDQIEGEAGKGKTLFANMIKIGISTMNALDKVGAGLGTPSIGYAGLKDEDAITAQLIALHKLKLTTEEIKKIDLSNVLLSNFFYGEKTLRPGYLEGNVFTIAIRTKDQLSEAELEFKFKNLEQFGFLNYYQSQRFGGIRLDSHKIGKLIMQGNYELAVKYLLFKTNEFEMPIIGQIKKEGEKHYPDYVKVIEIFNELPFTFNNELKVLNHLRDYPGDHIGALQANKESITICLYAYASLLFNKYLSDYSKKNGCLDEQFPLLLSRDWNDYKIYKNFLEEDKTTDFIKNINPLKFVYIASRKVPGRVFPKNVRFKTFNGGVIVTFFLPKGSYATTFLTNIFELFEGDPVPDWVKETEVDAKELLGQGNLKVIKEKFKNYWHIKIS